MIKTNWTKKLLTALLAFTLVFGVASVLPVGVVAKADNVEVSNADFSAYSGDQYAPDSWEKLGDKNTEIFSGVYDGGVGYKEHGFLDDSVLSKDNEYKNFLVINSKQYSAYSAYSSSDIEVLPSSYYQFVVRAKANVTVDHAYFMITGLDEEIALPIKNDGSWANYKIYLATDFDTTGNVKITLSFGKDGAQAKGYAMFDDVSVETMTAADFHGVHEADTVLVKNLETPFVDGVIKGGDFTTIDYNNWTVGSEKYNAGVKSASATNTNITEGNANVTAPNYVGTENNVLHLYSMGEEGGYVSITSNEFTVNPDEIYRVSYYVFNDGETESSGVGATAKLYYKYAKNASFKEVTVNNIQTTTSATENASHYGWMERNFYVVGSSYTDVTAKIEFALGAKDSATKGSVLIDDVRVQKITNERYTELAPDASVVANADAAITDNSGVTNGIFKDYTIDKNGTRIPSSWTAVKVTDTDVASFGYSSAEIENNAKFEVVNSLETPGVGIGAYELAVKLSSEKETAAGIRSAAINVESGKYKMITVDLSAYETTGYGANLVIRKASGAIVAKIENITEKNFYKYQFCIKGDESDTVAVNVEIWLGINDRNVNRSKLAAGDIYVKNVSAADSTEEVYNAFTTSNRKHEQAGSVGAENWLSYDESYDYQPATSWQIKQVQDGKVFANVVTYEDEQVIKYENVSPNATAIVLDANYTVAASAYAKISLKLKIEGNLADIDTNEKNFRGVWAGVMLEGSQYTDSKYTVKNIKETTLKTDKTNYLTVEFFVKGSTEASKLVLFVAMGEDIEPKQNEVKVPYTQGSVYIKDVKFETSTTTEYTNAENDRKFSQVIVNLGTEEEEKEDSSTSNQFDYATMWTLIGSIIFAVVIVVIVVVLWVKKAKKKREANKKVVVGRPSYDRNVAGVGNNDSTEPEKKVDEKTGAVEEQADIDQFSDENAPKTENAENAETEVENVEAEEVAPEAETENAENVEAQPEATDAQPENPEEKK